MLTDVSRSSTGSTQQQSSIVIRTVGTLVLDGSFLSTEVYINLSLKMFFDSFAHQYICFVHGSSSSKLTVRLIDKILEAPFCAKKHAQPAYSKIYQTPVC